MSEYNRLTERIHGAVVVKNELGHDISFFGTTINNALDRLAELEDKIEQGTLIELPCKVGDMFYWYKGCKCKCLGIEIAKDGIYLKTVYDMKFLFGKEAFLTREEAEKRLKELQNG